MGMDPLTLSMIAMGTGQAIGGFEQMGANKQNRRAQERFRQQIMGMAQGMNWNPGQDGYMQMLRADPDRQMAANFFRNTMDSGNMFDVRGAVNMLTPLDTITNQRQLAQLQGTFTGLGQRFGSAAGRAQTDLLTNLGAQQSARNASIAQQAWETAQGRRMTAADALLGMQNQAFQMEQARRNYNLQLLGVQAGLQPAAVQPTQFGSILGSAGQMWAMYPMMQNFLRNQNPFQLG